MTVVRANAVALSELRTRVRDVLRDPESDFEGNAIPEGSRRYSNAMILRAINDALKDLQVQTGGKHPGEMLVRSGAISLDETGSADITGVIGGGTIYAVYLETTPGEPEAVVEYATPVELERFRNSMGSRSPRYTVVSSSLGGVVLKSRPVTDRRVVIDILAPPLIMAEATDLNPLRPEWEEFLSLCAAEKLQSPDNEFSEQSYILLERKRREFVLYATRRRGITRQQRTRRFRAAR